MEAPSGLKAGERSRRPPCVTRLAEIDLLTVARQMNVSSEPWSFRVADCAIGDTLAVLRYLYVARYLKSGQDTTRKLVFHVPTIGLFRHTTVYLDRFDALSAQAVMCSSLTPRSIPIYAHFPAGCRGRNCQ